MPSCSRLSPFIIGRIRRQLGFMLARSACPRPIFCPCAPTQVNIRIVRRLGRFFRNLGFLATTTLLFALLISWPLSFYRLHGFDWCGFRRYGIVAYCGCIQFRYATRTALGTDPVSVQETGFPNHPLTFEFFWRRSNPTVMLSSKLPSNAETFVGRQVPDPQTLTVLTFGDRYWIHGIPHWIPAIPLTSLAAWWISRHPRRRAAWRMARGLCPSCGYDLRASADRCPECGHACSAGNTGNARVIG